MKTLQHFAPLLSGGAIVQCVEPVYPSITYNCHTSIITGVYANKHGIPQNERVKRGEFNQPWFSLISDVKVPTLLDYAKAKDYTVCSLSWPVSGGADYHYNLPMIVPYTYNGWNPEPYLRGKATDNLMDAYWWKYGYHQMGNNRSLDAFTMAVAPDLIRDFGQPDVMIVKLCDLDSARHKYGVYSEEAQEILQRHNEEFGVIVEAIRRFGDYNNTNFVILGDHGQTNVEDVFNMNVLLREHGFLRLNADGEIESYDALCHSVGLSAWIEISNPQDEALHKRVHTFLLNLRDDPNVQLKYVFTKAEAEERFKLTGPFEFVIESRRNISFWEGLTEASSFSSRLSGHKYAARASHGGLPWREETTTFIAYGPSVKAGAFIERADMVDEAPTMARMLGFDMPDVDGRVLHEILKEE
jgi:predicted AlkP superfamily pyrophosphatase or phosphodiesterase